MKNNSRSVKILSVLLLIAIAVIAALSFVLWSGKGEKAVVSTSGLTRVVYRYQDQGEYYLTILGAYGVPANVEVTKELYDTVILDEKVEYPFSLEVYDSGRAELLSFDLAGRIDNRDISRYTLMTTDGTITRVTLEDEDTRLLLLRLSSGDTCSVEVRPDTRVIGADGGNVFASVLSVGMEIRVTHIDLITYESMYAEDGTLLSPILRDSTEIRILP